MLWISADPDMRALYSSDGDYLCQRIMQDAQETQNRQQVYAKTHTNDSIQQPHEAPKCEYTVEFEINDMQVSDVAGQLQIQKPGMVPERTLPGRANHSQCAWHLLSIRRVEADMPVGCRENMLQQHNY